jgi:undecaprenyl-diphosphatase
MSLPELDTLIFIFINKQLQNNILDMLMTFMTERAYLFFLPPFLWFFFRDKKKTLVVLLLAILSLLLADWIGNSLKYYFERIRPCNEIEGVRVLVGCGGSFSMPSNHAANAFAFAIPFFIFFKNKIRYAFLAVALLVALSRIYVGVHYPSDVLAGAFLGSALALSVSWLYNWSSDKAKERPYSTILFLCLLSFSLFRIYYILHGALDLTPDEAHYWEWSRRLDLSYYSKGPMIAYLIYIGTSLFGDSVFGIRIMAVLCSTLSSIFLYFLGKKLYDESVGLFSAVLMQIIPLFSTFGFIFTIDSPFILFWTVSLLLFCQATIIPQRRRENPLFPNNKSSPFASLSPNNNHESLSDGGREEKKDRSLLYWCLSGITVGLGLLTKYTMAFFYPCALLFLLFSKDLRRILFTKGPYIGLIISFLIFSPVIIWNANYDWVTLKHTAGQTHIAEGFQISLKSFFEFIGSQVGVLTPILFVLMALSLWKLRKNREGAFLYWFSIPVVIFFIFKSIQGKVQANWALPGYITWIVAFSSYYMKRFYTLGKVMQFLIVSALIISLGVTSVAHYPSIVNLPVKLDPTERLHGWQELGEEVTRIYKEMSATHPVFIFSDTYQVSSQLAFYIKGHPVTYCINLGRRMNQYDIWPGFHDLIHYDAIFVMVGDHKFPEELAPAFQKVEKRVLKAYTKKHVELRDYSIFLCYDFKGLKEEKPVTF